MAAFITPKLPNAQGDKDLHKPPNETQSPMQTGKAQSDFDDIIFESFNQSQESGGLFLEEDDSKMDTIKRCPPG